MKPLLAYVSQRGPKRHKRKYEEEKRRKVYDFGIAKRAFKQKQENIEETIFSRPQNKRYKNFDNKMGANISAAAA